MLVGISSQKRLSFTSSRKILVIFALMVNSMRKMSSEVSVTNQVC